MKLYLLIISVLSIIVFSGCDNDNFYLMKTGTFSDSKVAGIDYSCGENSGVTDINGKFTCKSDSSKIKFSVGSVTLGSIGFSDIKDFNIYPSDLIGIDRNNTQNPKLIHLLQFLQSIDSDKNPNNGIVIDDGMREKLSKVKSVNFIDDSMSEQKLDKMLKNVGRTLLKSNYAVAHYEDTLRDELNLSVDTVAPAPAILINKGKPNRNNRVAIVVTGEIGAKVFLDGITNMYLKQ